MATVQKRGDAYRIRASAGYDATGKQIMRSMTWRPAPGMSAKQITKELERQKVLFDEKTKSGHHLDGNIKFKDFAEKWFEDYGKEHLRERTYYRYKELAERTYTAIGHIRLDRLQPHHLLEFYRQLAEPGVNMRTGGGLSPKTIKHYHTFISSVMDRAVKWQLIQDNPCKRVDAPKVEAHEIDCLDETEAAQFMRCLQDEPVETQVIFSLLILTGMRRGELLGLEWTDIDFDNCTITIRRTSQYATGRGIYTDTTKTEKSKRTITIPVELAALLRQFRAWQGERRLRLGDVWCTDWAEHPRLFCQWDGKPMHPNTPYQMLQKFLDRHGIRRVSLHSLRHTNATLLIGSGADVRTVSSRLGHSQTSTTLNIYAHQLQSADKAASEALADTLIRKRPG
ncbi:tyrosine-type recombinase/integrase [Solibaculum intestinale]|uniref:Tyrosine-type recombinase/integrase n=1 Tax=Solibaculum intestinale TaxID=3133165 RepID=A0ABV1E1Q4_9FIRM